MADFVMHCLFGEDVIGSLDERAGKVAAYYRKAFNWGLQGPDILMAHHFVTGGDEITEAGFTLHKKNLDELFSAGAHNCLKAGNAALSRCMQAYFYGFICHYALDSMIHPYVSARIEEKIAEGPDDDDRMLHAQIETDMDMLLYEKRTGHKIHTFPLSDRYSWGLDLKRGRLLNGAIERFYVPVLRDVYDLPATEQEIRECIHSLMHLVALQYNIPQTARMIGEVITPDPTEKRRRMARIKYREPEWDALNLSHAKWTGLRGEEHTESVPDILEEAKEKAVLLTGRYTQMFRNHRIEKLHYDLDFSGSPIFPL
ncbi:MAG: zinc dependent phospholipase C family protein [Lachnospiraceae bacterium]|jgi:hypothetical protein|nr:zinc dependent phospholipase C family protein [Lachnospiraceae bacterium]MCI1727768.1 zinc dependent phospholipase C family protein [Lachnospiraceae bacterium]